MKWATVKRILRSPISQLSLPRLLYSWLAVILLWDPSESLKLPMASSPVATLFTPDHDMSPTPHHRSLQETSNEWPGAPTPSAPRPSHQARHYLHHTIQITHAVVTTLCWSSKLSIEDMIDECCYWLACTSSAMLYELSKAWVATSPELS